MANLIETLSEAAARGAQVTIITNGGYDAPPLTLKWTYQDHSYAPSARFRGAGYDLWVMDCDGDFSEWTLRKGPTKNRKYIIAEGQVSTHDPYYHFDAAMLAAEAALRSEVRKRISSLKDSSHG